MVLEVLLADEASNGPPFPKSMTLAMRRRLSLNFSIVTKSAALPEDVCGRASLLLCGNSKLEEFKKSFDIGSVIGTGTVAQVRLAVRKSDGLPMVAKLVYTTEEHIRECTREEYDIMRSFRHPSILHPEAFFECRCQQIICFEFCEEGSLEQCVQKKGPLSEEMTRQLCSQLLRAVSFLHHKRIVHRDLKPSNLLLTKNMASLKIADFNSAKRIGLGVAAGSAMLTDRGTKLYAAPELKFGLVWNERVDIWASGLCLYFMLRGKEPFDNADPDVSTALRTGQLPGGDWESLSMEPRDFIGQCLTVDMRDRPTAMELLLHPFCAAPLLEKRRRTRHHSAGLPDILELSKVSNTVADSSEPLGPIPEDVLISAESMKADERPKAETLFGWITSCGILCIIVASRHRHSSCVSRESSLSLIRHHSSSAPALPNFLKMGNVDVGDVSNDRSSSFSSVWPGVQQILCSSLWREPSGLNEVLQILVRKKEFARHFLPARAV
mmetsp:Transcript_2154/g.4965  ORF Transcript_2154/g.4965 Transcript_2154/m.4965 type:complete len:495 (+) Transcript_2154:58-1542(+)